MHHFHIRIPVNVILNNESPDISSRNIFDKFNFKILRDTYITREGYLTIYVVEACSGAIYGLCFYMTNILPSVYFRISGCVLVYYLTL